MKEARILLERLTEEFPPGKNQHHNITFDEKTKNIIITLMMNEKYHPYMINENDLDKPSYQLIFEIREMYNNEL